MTESFRATAPSYPWSAPASATFCVVDASHLGQLPPSLAPEPAMRPIRALMLVAAPLVLTACAAFNRTSASAPPRIVEVQNAHDSDVAVYLRRGNYEHPLGIVRANGRTTLV